MRLATRSEKRQLASTIEREWEDERDFVVGNWVLDYLDGDEGKPIMVKTSKEWTGAGERMRFEVKHPLFKTFAFYTR